MERKYWVILYDNGHYDEVYNTFEKACEWADDRRHIYGSYRIIEWR